MLPAPVEIAWKLFVAKGDKAIDGIDRAAERVGRGGCGCAVV